jgi:hypothetical protein
MSDPNHHNGAIGIEVDFIVRPDGFERVTGNSTDIVHVKKEHTVHHYFSAIPHDPRFVI